MELRDPQIFIYPNDQPIEMPAKAALVDELKDTLNLAVDLMELLWQSTRHRETRRLCKFTMRAMQKAIAYLLRIQVRGKDEPMVQAEICNRMNKILDRWGYNSRFEFLVPTTADNLRFDDLETAIGCAKSYNYPNLIEIEDHKIFIDNLGVTNGFHGFYVTLRIEVERGQFG